MKRLSATLVALLLLGLQGASFGAADARFPTDWTVVGTSPPGSFGDNPQLAEVGHQLGADLLEARIRMPDAEHVEFVIDLTNLPPTDGTPEVIRYTWDMTIDGEIAQLDGKFTNYSRGMCDPTAGCDPTDGDLPEDPGMAPFFFRANLEVLELPVLTFNAMEILDTIEADFDRWPATITVVVPVESINLVDGVDFGPCSRIGPGDGLRGGTVETSLAVWLTSAAFPADVIFGMEDFVAPPADDAEVDCDGNPLD